MSENSTPVTVLSGTLGAGKTTLLNHILRESDGRDLAVLVNDMGSVNVDADLVAERSDISADDEELIELSNGCICCELRGDLLDAVATLTREREFDALVVESTGVAEPLPVAQTLTLGFDQTDLDPTEFYEETGIEPLEDCHLDTTVTVIDAHQFQDALASNDVLEDVDTDKPLDDLLLEQIEFCDVLVLNKCDLVSEVDLERIEKTLAMLQPRARIVRTELGRIDPDAVLDTGRFDFEDASQSAGWKRELREPHTSAEEEHGVTSFVFEVRRPFHPERLADLLDSFPEPVIRSKGHFWLAGREEEALTLNVAGQSIRVGYGGDWFATLPPEDLEERLEAFPELEDLWDEEWGDRGTQLVCIGAGMDHERVQGLLERCLLTDEEMSADWSVFEDRFPTFDLAEEDEDGSEASAVDDSDHGTDRGHEHEHEAEEEVGLAD